MIKNRQMMKPANRLIITLTLGSVVWLSLGLLALGGLLTLSLMEALFLLAPLLIVPLGLELVDIPGEARLPRTLYSVTRTVQPVGAIGAVLTFFWPAGLVAGTFAAAWLIVTLLIALLGISRFFFRGKKFDWGEIGLEAGLAYLGIGGGWFALSRLGLRPLEFDATIVFLTAVHFHYAGFAAPIVAGTITQILTEKLPLKQPWTSATVLGLVAGTPLVAAGITFSPLLEVAGSFVLATSLALLVYLMKRVIFSLTRHRPAQLLLSVSGLSIILGLSLIYLYATGEFSGYTLITIPQMIRFHGVANALGFALCGLLGLNLLRRAND